MKRFHILLLSVCIVLLFTGSYPLKPKPKWFKGNLHTHSLWSDGDGYPEMIIDWYKTHGYNFLALSDHNVFADGEKWMTVRKSKMYEEAFDKYLIRFGEQWVNYKIDSGRTHVRLKTYAEYSKLFEDENFKMLRSEEITDKFDGKHIHINATNIQSVISPQGGKSVADVMQRTIDAVLRQRELTGEPMFPHINHPNFYYSITVDDFIAVKGERFFEVYNGHPLVHNYGDSLHPGTEQMWDMINIAYAKRNQPLLFGIASDDSHNYHEFGKSYSNAGRGWVMVKSDKLHVNELIDAMEEGDFYASTGVVLNDIVVKNGVLNINIKDEAGVQYKTEFIEVFSDGKVERIIREGKNASAKKRPASLFMRAKIISSKIKVNPFSEGEFEVAWTQPIQ
jgi:hypothetical protein